MKDVISGTRKGENIRKKLLYRVPERRNACTLRCPGKEGRGNRTATMSREIFVKQYFMASARDRALSYGYDLRQIVSAPVRKAGEWRCGCCVRLAVNISDSGQCGVLAMLSA
ncbi:hypothetical protein DPMN_147071 [Dreissena polymorpha]|uniref:Uncharacterized protein n=1 Tax=Dreissena polymorpha TaxID=45954 RepID=A0A9D4F8B4_DREPO|nr:hypothetical protein DPMN_147071 [Dreissena polymorpha]